MRATGLSATAFGQYAVNDPALLFDLRKGREIRRATRARILAFIQNEKRRALEPAR